MRKGFPLLPVLLIIVGAALLLDRTGVLAFGWWTVFWAVVALLGMYRMVQAFRTPSRGRMVWGTILFFVGLYCVLEDLGALILPGGMLFPALLAVVGLGFLLALLRQPREWHLAVPAVALLGTGALMLCAELNYLPRWLVVDLIRQWWPAALVLLGAALLLNSRTETKSSAQ